ncbi:unnamed protein product [Leptosia nina]|uniref:Uncharacterized protein n=1 Tax=Leptosia nina TaxID=320188 RepID=A0AAV1J4C7_9NEOP
MASASFTAWNEHWYHFMMPRTRRKHYASHSRSRSRSYEAKRRRIDDGCREESYRKRSRSRERDRNWATALIVKGYKNEIIEVDVRSSFCRPHFGGANQLR